VPFFDFDRSQTQMHYQFAWALMAGVGMTDHAQLDVGYRFLDLGAVSGFSGMTGTSVSQRVFVNELRAGVRYMID